MDTIGLSDSATAAKVKPAILCLAGLLMASGVAQATEVYTTKTLMLQALNSPDGKASGIVEDAVADKIHKTTGSYGRNCTGICNAAI